MNGVEKAKLTITGALSPDMVHWKKQLVRQRDGIAIGQTAASSFEQSNFQLDSRNTRHVKTNSETVSLAQSTESYLNKLEQKGTHGIAYGKARVKSSLRNRNFVDKRAINKDLTQNFLIYPVDDNRLEITRTGLVMHSKLIREKPEIAVTTETKRTEPHVNEELTKM